MAFGKKSKGSQAGDEGGWLEVDASMTGTLTFKDPVNLRINGRFDGTLDTKGKLFIGSKAQVKATIRGEMITVAGTIDGDISATSRFELKSTARITGNVTSPRVIMEDGAVLHGSLEMLGGGSTTMNTDELARYLEVDAATIIEWAKSGRLPSQQEDGQWRFSRQQIEEWLSREKIK